MFFFKKSSILWLKIFVLFLIDNLTRFSFKILIAILSRSTKEIFLEPLDMHSNPKDPIPQYKSKIFESSTLTFIRLEWLRMLKILLYTVFKRPCI